MVAVRTASGAKFESADKSIVFWSQGRAARVETTSGGPAGKGKTLQCTVTD